MYQGTQFGYMSGYMSVYTWYNSYSILHHPACIHVYVHTCMYVLYVCMINRMYPTRYVLCAPLEPSARHLSSTHCSPRQIYHTRRTLFCPVVHTLLAHTGAIGSVYAVPSCHTIQILMNRLDRQNLEQQQQVPPTTVID